MAHVRRGDHRPELRNLFTTDGVLPGISYRYNALLLLYVATDITSFALLVDQESTLSSHSSSLTLICLAIPTEPQQKLHNCCHSPTRNFTILYSYLRRTRDLIRLFVDNRHSSPRKLL